MDGSTDQRGQREIRYFMKGNISNIGLYNKKTKKVTEKLKLLFKK